MKLTCGTAFLLIGGLIVGYLDHHRNGGSDTGSAGCEAMQSPPLEAPLAG